MNKRILLTGCVLAGAFILFFASIPWGLGLSPDSTAYIGAARQLAKGRGFISTFNGNHPISQWPPLYSILLAMLGRFFGDPVPTARFLNISLFAVNGILIALYLKTLKQSWKTVFTGLGFYSMSRPMLEVHSWAHSEPVLIFTGFSGLFFLFLYLEQRTLRFYFLAIICFGAACLDRYAGVTFPIAGTLCILLFDSKRLGKRIVSGAMFGILSFLPLGLWLLRNHFVANDLTNRVFGLRLLRTQPFEMMFETMGGWFFPAPFLPQFKMLAGVIFFFVLICIFIYVFQKNPLKSAGGGAYVSGYPGTLLKVTCIFAASYILFFIVYMIFLSISAGVNDRLFSPLFFAVLLILIITFSRIAGSGGRLSPKQRHGAVFLITLLMLSYGIRTVNWHRVLWQNGLGFSGRSWRNSETIANLQAYPADQMIFTNAPDAIYILTGRNTLSLPVREKRDFISVAQRGGPGNVRADYGEKIAAVRESMQSGKGILVLFDLKSKKMARWYQPREPQLVNDLSLSPIKRFKDGAIFEIARASKKL